MGDLYNNDNYTVCVASSREVTIEGAEFIGCYVVRNVKTNIVEFQSPSLPECLQVATHWDIALQKEVHLWPYKTGSDDTFEVPSSALARLS